MPSVACYPQGAEVSAATSLLARLLCQTHGLNQSRRKLRVGIHTELKPDLKLCALERCQSMLFMASKLSAATRTGSFCPMT